MKIKHLKSLSDSFDLSMPANKPFDVVGFGLNSVDLLCVVPGYPQPESKTEILEYRKLAGGQVATAMVFLARMGLKTKYIGKIGGDEFGRFSLQSFAGETVDISSVLVEPEAVSQYSIIIVDRRSGARTVLCRRDLRLDFNKSELNEEMLCCGRIMHLDGYDTASLNAADICRNHKVPVCIDLDKAVPNCRELIDKIDFLIVSSNFPSEYTEIADPDKAFEALRQSYDGFLAMTLGPEGAKAWIGDKCVRFPGLKTNAVDTTGAGDIFHGAFLYGLVQNWPVGRIMNFANVAAGISCGYLGARTGIRTFSEIMQHIEDLDI
jgi:sulfofructose kinase